MTDNYDSEIMGVMSKKQEAFNQRTVYEVEALKARVVDLEKSVSGFRRYNRIRAAITSNLRDHIIELYNRVKVLEGNPSDTPITIFELPKQYLGVDLPKEPE